MHLENIIPIDLGEEINPHHQSLDVLTPNECVPPKLVPTSLPHLTPRRGELDIKINRFKTGVSIAWIHSPFW